MLRSSCLASLVLAAVVSSAAYGREFMAGADISSLPVIESRNAVYYDNGQPRDMIEMFSDHGVNWYRLRLFVDPKFENNWNGGFEPFVAQDLEYTIALAQRVKQAGGKILLDFHYSDTWADPGHQWKPEAWRSLTTMPELQQKVYDYTKESIEAFKAADVLPEMVQIGNEIASGLLWNGEYVQNVNNTTVGGATTGYPWTGGSNNTGFDRLATLLSAGIKGARDGAGPGEEPEIMIHHDQGSRWATTSYYFDRLLPRLQANGADIDVIGYSYYPLYHPGGVSAVQQNLINTANAYGKPVAIVEAGFPSRNPQSDEQNLGFPVTPEGQQAYLEALVDAVQAVPNDRGLGVFWWFAEARPVSGLSVWEGGRYGLFDQNGNLLPAIQAFEGLNPSVPGDFNGDGDVDGEDLAVWESAFGQASADGDADSDDDGDIDGADFLFWQQQLIVNDDSPTAAVPEPALIPLCSGLFAAGVGARRRSRRVILTPSIGG